MRWGIVLSLICLGCGAASSATNQTNAKINPRLLYPMKTGNAWSYEVDTSGSDKMLTVHRVLSVEGDQVQILTGKDVQHFRVSDEGILRVSNGVWLLRAPIEVDAEWPSSSGMTARVTSINAKVDTPEGKFKDCVEIQESGGDSQRQITTIYCVGVGPVYVESKMTVQDRQIGIVGRLRGHEVQ